MAVHQFQEGRHSTRRRLVTDEKGLERSDFHIKDEEDVKELGRVYIRQKRDYPFEFAKLKLQTEATGGINSAV